jgi:hypothetical protein
MALAPRSDNNRRQLASQETHLLADLDALNEARLCAPYPPICERLDEATVRAI